eukprot:g2540.t1
MRIFRFYTLLAILFNAYSFASIVSLDGPAFTKNDPVLAIFFAIAMGLLTEATARIAMKTVHALSCVVFAVILAKKGIIEHIISHDVYMKSDAYFSYVWILGVALNVFGFLALCRRISSVERTIVVGLLAIVLFRYPTTYDAAGCSDVPSFFTVDKSSSLNKMPHLPFRRTSKYVEMSDGVKLAVDVYLPRGSAPRGGRPTFLHFTRYQRTLKRSLLSRYITLYDQPAQPTFNLRSLRYIEHFVADGYAYVTVDTRGAGASEGTKPVDMLPREVADLKEITDWTLGQTFCDGNIASGGVSYDGMMAAAAAAQGNIKAIGLIGFYGDVYKDVAMIGGIPCKGFGDSYAAFTSASERNEPVSDPQIRRRLPCAMVKMQELLFDGVAPVDADETGAIMRAAIKEHENNYDMRAKSRQESVLCHDDVVAEHENTSYTWSDISNPERTINGLLRHGVSVSTWAGYYDAGSLRASTRLHNALVDGGGRSRLVAGPWSHGLRSCYTPNSGKDATTPSFPLYYDLKRFVDCQLRERGCRVDLDAGTAHYFITGPDEFRSTRGVFPPRSASLRWRDLWADINDDDRTLRQKQGRHNLRFGNGSSEVGVFVDYDVDPSTTTGLVSRWNLVQHLMKRPVTYEAMYDNDSKRKNEAHSDDSGSLIFESPELDRPLRMIGSAAVELQIEIRAPVDAHDAVIFAYLEDVDDDGGLVHYVTEGQVRASHAAKKSGLSRVVGDIDSVTRSYRRADLRKLSVNGGPPVVISFALEPTAYEFPAGHRVRLRFTGADADNFYLGSIDGRAEKWRVFEGATRIRLPVVSERAA